MLNCLMLLPVKFSQAQSLPLPLPLPLYTLPAIQIAYVLIWWPFLALQRGRKQTSCIDATTHGRYYLPASGPISKWKHRSTARQSAKVKPHSPFLPLTPISLHPSLLTLTVSACRGRLSDKAKTWPAQGHVYRSARHEVQDTKCVPALFWVRPLWLGKGLKKGKSCSCCKAEYISIFARCISWIAFKQHLCIFNVTTEMMRHSRRQTSSLLHTTFITFAPPAPIALTLGIRCIERPTYSYENCVQVMQFVVLWNFTTLWQRSTLARAKTAVNQRIMCRNFVDSAGFHILHTYISLHDEFKGNLKRNLLEINRAAAVIIK